MSNAVSNKRLFLFSYLISTLALYTHCFLPACGKGRLRKKGVHEGRFFGLI
jgi:hypothetical protein